MNAKAVCIGVDTSLRSTGWGVVASDGSCMRGLGYGVIRVPAQRPHSDCFLAIRSGLMEAIKDHGPVEAAIEGVFFSRNMRTTLILGEARGVALLTLAEQGLPVYEFAPRRVKQAVVGYGAAGKQQVSAMVCRMLGIETHVPEDAADALALAICRLHVRESPLVDECRQI